MAASVKLADYIFRRLQQLGVQSIHGVPGDYNLTLLDYVEPAGLRWIGNANELNAAYAADGYARIMGIGAVVTTFGVGELSAANAIAGAYAEFAPVIHIVGTPPRYTQDSRLRVHHTFADGEYRRFSQMYAHITVAQASLWDISTSAEQIDEALRQCLIHHRPVYIQVPMDLVTAQLPADRLRTAITLPTAVSSTLDARNAVLTKILAMIDNAEHPIIYADGETRPLGIVQEVQAFIDSVKWPTWIAPFGKGLFDETRPYFHGINKGKYNDPEVQDFISKADLVLHFGPHPSSSNTYSFSSIPDPQVTISFSAAGVEIGTEVFQDLPAKLIMSLLLDHVDFSKVTRYDPYPNLPRDSLLSISDIPAEDSISQESLWRVLANFLRPGDIVLGETGTAGYGVREMPLPVHTRAFTPVTWLSIGYMLPAAQGAALAQRDGYLSSQSLEGGRTILLIGDGSFQMTVQELSTIIRHDLNVVVILINNDGYTIERCIHGRNQSYNDISKWRYLEAPSFLGASEDTFTASVETWAELRAVLEHDQLNRGTGLRMVEILVDREDVPRGPLRHYLKTQVGKE